MENFQPLKDKEIDHISGGCQIDPCLDMDPLDDKIRKLLEALSS